ncbi:MAG TPA: hypothetical protein VHI30_00480, partial [Gaiellales bacterium]|nr:hypothetical protein [Gaiellales bacterium]
MENGGNGSGDCGGRGRLRIIFGLGRQLITQRAVHRWHLIGAVIGRLVCKLGCLERCRRARRGDRRRRERVQLRDVDSIGVGWAGRHPLEE